MYNRYIPQPDGSYRRNPTQEPRQHPQRSGQPKTAPPPKSPAPSPETVYHPPHQHHPVQEPVGGFLRQLIPKGFDTGDLIVVLLLLLMAADCKEGQNSALLTLALYLFL